MDEMTPICQNKDLPLGSSTTCRLESLEPPVLSLFMYRHLVHWLSQPFVSVSVRLASPVVFLGLKMGKRFVISCGLLHVYEQTGGVLRCSPVWLSPFCTHISSVIRLCDSS